MMELLNWEWLVLLLCLPVLGHVLYGIPPDPREGGEGPVTLYNGDGFSLRDEAPRPERMLRVRAVSDAGVTALAVSGTRQSGVMVDATAVKERPCWVVVETEPTLIELEGGKFQGYLNHEGLNEVIERRIAAGCQGEPGREIYSKYVKVALNSHNGGLRLRTEAVNLPVEIVPLSTDELEVGMRLPLRVLVAGEPVVGLQVRVSHRAAEAAEPSDDVLCRTDGDGKASIAIDKPGIWRVHAIAMAEASPDEHADWESLWAGLTFRVNQEERAMRR